MLYLRNQTPNLARYLPQFLQEDEHFKATLAACSTEHEKYRLLIDEITNQFYVETATWGLSDWERILDLKPDAGDSYEQRRNRILLYLQGRQISTVDFLERLSSRYVSGGSAHIVERNEQNIFNVCIDGDLSKLRVDRKGLHEGLDIYKPAHLAYGIIAIPSRQMFLNRCGPVQIRPAKATTWTETQRHVVFSCGLNASGEVETISRTSTTRANHLDRLFTASTLSGRLRLNNVAKTTTMKDLGGTVTEHWLVFVGSRTNSRAPLRLNDARKETRSRSYHRADWREVSCYTNCLNAARSRERRWQEISSRTTTAHRFKRPGCALNQCGTVTTKRMDVGRDAVLAETFFTGSVLNNAKALHKVESITQTVARERTAFTGARLNSQKPIVLNQACSSLHVEKQSRTITKGRVQFTGSLLSGKLILNGGKPMTITRTVHIPVWRDVKCYKGAALLNAAAHHIKEIRITHTEQGHPEKYFDPRRGTLLNDHAVLGYLRL